MLNLLDRHNPAPTAEQLSAAMDFGHIIQIDSLGALSDAPETAGQSDGLIRWVPECLMDDEGFDVAPDATEAEKLVSQLPTGWALITGYTGQYSYNGPCMHASEYIGGGLAADILATPGYYVALTIETDDLDNPAGWTIAYSPRPGCDDSGPLNTTPAAS